MSILPEKRKFDNVVHTLRDEEYYIEGYNDMKDLCQQAVDKAVEKASNSELFKEILYCVYSQGYQDSIKPVPAKNVDNDIFSKAAEQLSAHIKRAFGKE